MRAQVELFARNRHCKHIIFGGADNGYVGFLDTFAKVSGVNQDITLIDGPLTPCGMRKALLQFCVASFPNIFRLSKISLPKANGNDFAGMKRTASQAALPSPLPIQRRPSPPQTTHTYTTPPGINGYASGPARHSMATTSAYPTPKTLFINKYGQRLDRPLDYDKQFLSVLFSKLSRLCNNYYLKGYCGYGNNCSWDHSEYLNKIQIDTLRHKARTSSCRDPFCADLQCSLGHMCKNSLTTNFSLFAFM